MKRKTNFDRYLEEQMKDPAFAGRYQKAGEAWEVALQLAALRKKAGLSQKELAQRVGTSQRQISRLESTSYEGHSLSMLRRVAEVLGATVSERACPALDARVRRKSRKREINYLKIYISWRCLYVKLSLSKQETSQAVKVDWQIRCAPLPDS